MNEIYLITGGNIGNKRLNLETAAVMIEKNIGKIIRSSKIYETDAWGITDQDTFYNQVHLVKSKLSAQQIIRAILKVEKEMGRIRTIKNAARIIDIDILLFNDEIINEQDLTIPHKEIPNRRFVLTPLNELAPQLIHPVLKKNIHALLADCTDNLKVTPVNNL